MCLRYLRVPEKFVDKLIEVGQLRLEDAHDQAAVEAAAARQLELIARFP
jgi:hypothetical protein